MTAADVVGLVPLVVCVAAVVWALRRRGHKLQAAEARAQAEARSEGGRSQSVTNLYLNLDASLLQALAGQVEQENGPVRVPVDRQEVVPIRQLRAGPVAPRRCACGCGEWAQPGDVLTGYCRSLVEMDEAVSRRRGML